MIRQRKHTNNGNLTEINGGEDGGENGKGLQNVRN